MGQDDLNPLNRIFERLDDITRHLERMDDRLKALEEPRTEADQADADAPSQWPASPAVPPPLPAAPPPAAGIDTILKTVSQQADDTDNALTGKAEVVSDAEIPADAEIPVAEPLEAIMPPARELPPVAPPAPAPALDKPPAPAPEPEKPQAPTLPPMQAPPPPQQPARSFEESIADFRQDALPKEDNSPSWEFKIAQNWLPFIGLGFLAIAGLLLGRELAQGPLGKVVGVYILSAVMIVVGLWKERAYPKWARPVLAGGLAFSYFASYAMGFIEPMRLLDTLSQKIPVLAANLLLILGVAQWKRSEVIAGTAIVLGFLTTGVMGSDVAALYSSLALSVVAIFFLWYNQWFAASSVAVVATYAAHFYVWKMLPSEQRSSEEAFWFHAMFLSLYFVVYTAAGLVGRRAALNDDRYDEDLTKSPRALLTFITQANLTAYIAGMITVLRLTAVYWETSWLFFLPAAIVMAGLALMFAGLSVIQNSYFIGATVCLSFGIAALATPLWLPIFLVGQAWAMLYGSRGKNAALWQLLSLLVLSAALAYLLTNGQVNLFQMTIGPEQASFPIWVQSAVALMMLGYAATWEKWVAERGLGNGAVYGAFVAFLAGLVWMKAHFTPHGEVLSYIGTAAVPVVGAAMVALRIRCFITFAVYVGVGTFLSLLDLRMPFAPGIVALGAAGLAVGYLVEKRGTGHAKSDRWLWRGMYIWGQLIILQEIVGSQWERQNILMVLVGSFGLTLLLSLIGRSAALSKSAYAYIIFIVIAPIQIGNNLPFFKEHEWFGPVCLVITALMTYPLTLPAWREATGDTAPLFHRICQTLVLISIGGALLASSPEHWNRVVVSGAWALFCAVFAGLGVYRHTVWAYGAAVMLAAMSLVVQLGNGTLHLSTDNHWPIVAWTLAGIAMIVAGERALKLLPRGRAEVLSGQWIYPPQQELLTKTIAFVTLVMAVLSLNFMQNLELFYYTGGIACVAFSWIVLGFWFSESAYRKTGFIALLIALAKGLVIDLWSLKEPIYRIFSVAGVGILTIMASFLYSRYWKKLSETQPPGEGDSQ